MADLRPLNRTIGRSPGRELTSYRQKGFRAEIHDAQDDGVPTCDDNDWHSEILDILKSKPGALKTQKSDKMERHGAAARGISSSVKARKRAQYF